MKGLLKKCDYYSDNQDTCNSKIPVNGDGNDYDYSKRCFYDETKEIKCQTLDRLCTDYSDICNDIPGILLNKEICEQLIVKDTNKRCVYKGGICQEEYKSCELYSSNEIEKQRENVKELNLVIQIKNVFIFQRRINVKKDQFMKVVNNILEKTRIYAKKFYHQRHIHFVF